MQYVDEPDNQEEPSMTDTDTDLDTSDLTTEELEVLIDEPASQ